MTAKQVLLDQLTACHDKDGWFVCMHSALGGLTTRQASTPAPGSAHSIWQILEHVTFWNDRYLRRFHGKTVEPVNDNDSTFRVNASGDEAWAAARARFDEVMESWKSTLQGMDDSKLDAPVAPDSKETWGSKLANMILHAGHHIGQIVTLRKTQGSWDTAKGVS